MWCAKRNEANQTSCQLSPSHVLFRACLLQPSYWLTTTVVWESSHKQHCLLQAAQTQLRELQGRAVESSDDVIGEIDDEEDSRRLQAVRRTPCFEPFAYKTRVFYQDRLGKTHRTHRTQ
jgi:hypothetical protein